jgi:site-specific recombinase XerD
MAQVYKEHEQKQSPALLNFLESLSPSKYTRRTYLKNLQKFMNFFNIDDPQTLLSWNPKVIEENISRFIISTRNAGSAQWSIYGYFAAVRHFYEMNDVLVNWKRLKKFVGRIHVKRTNDRPYTLQKIHKLLEHATPREKVVVLLMCSAGLRVGSISSICVGHLSKVSIGQEQYIYQIHVLNNKGRAPYDTLCSFECVNAIDTYLEYRRNRLNETITEVSPLIVNLADKEAHNNCTNVGGATSTNGIKIIIDRLLYDSGLRRVETKKEQLSGQRYLIASCHSMRKFFASQLEHANMKDMSIEKLLGHSTGLRGVYRKIIDDDLIQEYIRCMSHLTINDIEREKLRADKLEAENTEQKRTIATVMDMYDEMRKEINEIKNERVSKNAR